MSDFDGEDASGFGSNGFQMMGMMNALKTGDVQTDMMIAMCVPFVLKMLFGWAGKLEDLFDFQTWARWWEGQSSDHERFITHNTTRNCWGGVTNMDEDTQNSVLLKSIKMYLHQVVKIKLKTANLDLTGMEDTSTNDYHDDSDDEDDEEHGSRRTLVGTLSRYKIINRLPNNEWHELGVYGTDSPSMVKLRIEHESRKEGDGKEKENSRSFEVNQTTFHFTSPGEGAIDAFIDTAYKWYIGELRKLEDNSRYLYEMKAPEIRIGGNNNNDDGDSSGGTTYKRYKLSEDKSFESLFFREKDSLLGLIDHFSAKSGKYSIKGYPHKLGVMLHGPPGTGKTSLIKALAQYTGRSIVNVPLSRVSTNSELMSIFFDRNYHVEGAFVPVKMNFKDVIFVMEDVDAASKIVKRRDGRTSAQVVEAEKIELPMPKSLWRMFLESSHDDCKALVKDLVAKSERLKEEAEAMKPEVLCAIAQRVTGLPALGLVSAGVEDPAIAKICEQAMESANAQNSQYSKLDDILSSHAQAIKALIESSSEVEDDFVEELLGETGALTKSIPNIIPTSTGASSSSDFNESAALEKLDVVSLGSEAEKSLKGKGISFGPSLFKPNPDQLSLSGLLNVLDGVVDTPGRIMVMTTNHPEILDPALIRPGRVDKKIMLGYMASADIICMLEHYFQTTLSNTQVARVEDIVNGDGDPKFRLKFTPAQVEQLASEHDRLEDMLDAMDKVGESLRPYKRENYVTKAHSWEADRR